MARIDLPYGRRLLPIEIPDDYLGEVVAPPRIDTVVDPSAAIAAALASPIGCLRLAKMVQPKQKAVVIIDDITRETPTRMMLPPVLEELAGAGVENENISIVIALGTHRPMTQAEIDKKIGPMIARDYRIVNVSARDAREMVYVGTSSLGIPACVNRFVAEADIRVGIGMIAPHLDAGFGGGAKIILPGVCSEETVAAFHAQMANINTNQLGVEEAALRLDLEKFVRECVKLDFILNAILDSNGALYRCVAGDSIKAHRAGVRFALKAYGVTVKRRYPLVIVNAYPHWIDLWQTTKALASGELLTEKGGMLLLVADCPEGYGAHPLFAEYIGKDLDALLQQFNGGQMKDQAAAAEAVAVCRMKRQIRIGLVSSGFSANEVRRMGFSHYRSVEEAIGHALQNMPEKKIGVITHGGTTIPLLSH